MRAFWLLCAVLAVPAAAQSAIEKVVAAQAAQIEELRQELAAQDGRVAAVEGRSTALEAGAAALAPRVTALEGGVATTASRVTALEARDYKLTSRSVSCAAQPAQSCPVTCGASELRADYECRDIVLPIGPGPGGVLRRRICSASCWSVVLK